MKLALLILTVPKRKLLLDRLLQQLEQQIGNQDVELIINDDRTGHKGAKRNECLQEAISKNAQVISFIDDDDLVGDTYIKRGLEFVESGLDVCELWGLIYFNGKMGNPFHHSIIHKEWYQDANYYYRCPNHLNFVRLEKVKGVRFPTESDFGEDGQWSMKVKELGLLKTEYKVPEILYHYLA